MKVRDEAEIYRARWSAIVDAAVDGIVVIDARGLIRSFNRAAEELFGWSEEEVRGENVSTLMPEPDRSGHDGYIARYRREGDPRVIGVGREVTARRRDGTTFPIHLSVGEFRIEDEHGFVGIVHDRTERRQAEREMQAQRDRLAHVSRLTTVGEMASGISHEVNQPLSAIANYSQALSRMMDADHLDVALARQVAQKIYQQAQRAGDVIRRVRSFASRREIQREQTRPAELIEETLVLAETDAKQHGVSTRMELAEALPDVRVDPVQFQQVLLNLVRNGLEAMGEVGKTDIPLIVRARGAERGLVIEVIDRGDGIEEEQLERMFSPFFTTKSSGMGLGLVISRSIVESYGGRLSFRRNPESGMTFEVRLPAAEENDDG